jgi:iron complex outermembrane receptor protein
MRSTIRNWTHGMKLRALGIIAALAPVCCFVVGVHAADNNDETAQDEPKLEEVVVTGTLIRGVAPTGAEMISVTPQDIAATGATTTDQLLSNVPQGNFFNNPPQVLTNANAGLQINRPNLRNLPLNTASGAATATASWAPVFSRTRPIRMSFPLM